MLKKSESQSGAAAVELAVMLPVLVMLLLLIVEGASAMGAYSSLAEISREGARMVLRQNGETGGVVDLVDALADNVLGKDVDARVATDQLAKTVTVEVDYAYNSFFGENNILQAFTQGPVVLSAKTTMPLP